MSFSVHILPKHAQNESDYRPTKFTKWALPYGLVLMLISFLVLLMCIYCRYRLQGKHHPSRTSIKAPILLARALTVCQATRMAGYVLNLSQIPSPILIMRGTLMMAHLLVICTVAIARTSLPVEPQRRRNVTCAKYLSVESGSKAVA